jgi:hypothetical protein
MNPIDEAAAQEPRPVVLVKKVAALIRDGELDEAERLLDELVPLVDDPDEYLIFPILIAIQRGQVAEAYRFLCTFDESKVIELKALCLNIMGDVSWHGLAREAAEGDADPWKRRAMKELLGMPTADDPELVIGEPRAAMGPEAPVVAPVPNGIRV